MWAKTVTVLVVGYLTMGRSFSYLGLAPIKLFIGDMALAAFLLLHTREWLDRWIHALFRPSPLNGVAAGLLFFMTYGWFEVLRGISSGYPALQVIQNFVFHAYPLYLFVGIWAGLNYRGLLSRVVRTLAAWNGIYGVLYIAIFDRIQQPMPFNSGVALYGQPSGAVAAILGLVCFERDLRRVWWQLLLNSCVLLGLQVRAEFLGVLIGLVVWVWLTGKIGGMTAGVAALALLLGIGYITDFTLPGTGNRGGEISTKAIVGRTLAPLDPDLAAEYSTGAKGQAGSVVWRQKWWRAIWESVHADPILALIGHGYGFPLSRLVSYIRDESVRTPHNVFYYALGYGGWLGVGIFGFFLLQLALALWRAYSLTGQPYGVVLCAQMLSTALFSNQFETPFGAIPFYLLTGLCLAPLLAIRSTHEYSASAQLLSAVRG